MSDAVKFSENLSFLQNSCFHQKVWSGEFFDCSWMFVCSMWIISCKTLEGLQHDLGPVEAVEGQKMAMLKKNRACQIIKKSLLKC
jgi:hypothetical protein